MKDSVCFLAVKCRDDGIHCLEEWRRKASGSLPILPDPHDVGEVWQGKPGSTTAAIPFLSLQMTELCSSLRTNESKGFLCICPGRSLGRHGMWLFGSSIDRVDCTTARQLAVE